MAWPYDAKHTVMAALRAVPSAMLNAVQDRIVDLFASRQIITLNLHPTDILGAPSWALDPNHPEDGWIQSGAGYLFGHLDSPVGLVVTAIKVKQYNGDAVDHTPSTYAVLIDTNMDAAANAPTIPAAAATNDTEIAATSWGVCSMTGLSIAVTSAHRFMLIIGGGADDSDKVAGVELTVRPLTASS
jgi:hypothetical protein